MLAGEKEMLEALSMEIVTTKIRNPALAKVPYSGTMSKYVIDAIRQSGYKRSPVIEKAIVKFLEIKTPKDLVDRE